MCCHPCSTKRPNEDGRSLRDAQAQRDPFVIYPSKGQLASGKDFLSWVLIMSSSRLFLRVPWPRFMLTVYSDCQEMVSGMK